MVCDGGVATSYTSAVFEKTCPTFQQLERKVTFLYSEQRKKHKNVRKFGDHSINSA